MLTEEDAREYYRQITGMLSQSKLSWILPQVQEEIASGKITTKPVKDISLKQSVLFEVSKEPRGVSKDKVSTSEVYTYNEQLTMLLTALEEISDLYLIKSNTFSIIRSFNENVSSIQFVSPNSDTLPESPIEEIILNEKNDMQTFQKLKEVISLIKKEI